MGKIDNQGNWEKIQKSVQETERLMGQKKYNLSMIKARQTMEFMVKLQCDKAGIIESTTDQMIRDLYEEKVISKSTAEHYLQILSIGNKATKEGDNSAYNANQAYHVLSQEIYSFVDSDKASKPRRSTATRQQQSQQTQSRKRQSSSSSSARSSKSSRSSKNAGLNTDDLIKLFIPIVLVIILIVLIKVLTPDKDPTSETTTPEAQVTTTTEAEVTTEAVPEVPTETAAQVIYKTTTTLNVRSGPSIETDRIGKLDPDQTVNFVRDHDDFWAVILYNDQEAYVAKEYLTVAAE